MNKFLEFYLIFSLAFFGLNFQVFAQFASDNVPMQLQGGWIEEKLGNAISLDTEFTDSDGNTVSLSKFVDGTRPVIFTLNYYNCPMLCTLTLNGLVDGMRKMNLDAGPDFRVVTISIDPSEKFPLAKANKKGYLSKYDRESSLKDFSSWSFLTGGRDNIEKIASEFGFGYKYDESIGEYLHTSSIIFVSPSGVITRYMNDVNFAPFDLKKALIESGDGKVGSPMETFIFFNCYQYDPERGSYVPSAWKLMRLGGIGTVLFIIGGVLFLNSLEKRSKSQDLEKAS